MKITTLNFKKNFNNLNFCANPMPKNEAEFLKKRLLRNPSADIFTHESTDKDAINSALAISNYLENNGVKTRIVLSGKASSLDIQDSSKNIIQASNYSKNPDETTYLCVDFSKKERIPKNILNHVDFTKNDIYCFDHHTDSDIGQTRVIYNKTQDTSNDNSTGTVYVDSSAKSATSVIYRFFEALGEDYDNLTALEMFYGLTSDCYKKGLVKIDGKKGAIEPTKELSKDKNAIEIFEKLKKSLSKAQIKAIAENIDIISTLNKKEEEFYNSLFDRMQFSPDKKTAYVALAPNDAQWEELDEDNQRTSAILNYFRQKILKENKDIENAVVFYKAGENYRLSIHSKKDLNDTYQKAQQQIKDGTFSIGGHENRGGGKIISQNPETCAEFVNNIINILSN